MTDHVHTWTPIPLAFARYECTCGATGYRKGATIVEHKTKSERRTDVTARGSRKPIAGGRIAEKDYNGD